MRPRMLMVRGLPGSGKSTYVVNNYPGLFVLETDCFNCVAGQYYWTVDRSREAISIIKDIVGRLMCSSNTPDFAICGVFARPSTMLDHIDAALDNNYDVYIKTLTTQYENIHNVPKDTLDMFKKNFVSDNSLKDMFKNFDHIFFTDMPQINWTFLDNKKPSNDELKYEGEG